MLKLVSDNVIFKELFWELKNYVGKIATDKYLFVFHRKINIFYNINESCLDYFLILLEKSSPTSYPNQIYFKIHYNIYYFLTLFLNCLHY